MQTYVETSLGRIAIEQNGAGTPLLLLHSGGHDRHDFDAIVPRLAQRYRTVAVDLLGHGSSAVPDRIDTPSISRAVAETVEALDLPPAIVLGNSVGGIAALHLAATAPERVRALVLVSPSGLIAQTPLMRAFCWLQGREAVRRHLGMAFARHYLVRRSAHGARLLERMAERRRDRGFIAMEAALWRSFGRPESDLAPLAPRVRQPTLLMWGRHDPVIRARVEGTRARALLPHAAFIDLDAGHVPFVETPEAFLEATEPFLVRNAASGAPAAREGATGAPG